MVSFIVLFSCINLSHWLAAAKGKCAVEELLPLQHLVVTAHEVRCVGSGFRGQMCGVRCQRSGMWGSV